MIRIVTWNIRNGQAEDGPDHWNHRKEGVADLIRDLDPDVLALQEPFGFQMDFVARAMPNHSAIGVGRDDGIRSGEYCGLFVRASSFQVANSGTFWLSKTPSVPGSCSWGNVIPRCCTWAELNHRGSSFLICNVHLDHESQPSRVKGVELVLERIEEARLPAIVAGDFNAEPDSLEIALIPLTSALLGTPDENQGTWHGFTGTTQTGPIDHVFIDPHCFKIERAWIDRRNHLGRYPSDHFALIADLAFSATTSR